FTRESSASMMRQLNNSASMGPVTTCASSAKSKRNLILKEWPTKPFQKAARQQVVAGPTMIAEDNSPTSPRP
ncbi:hypothetical protein TorRG33x02_341580, partial [Trema orientale]